MTYKYLASPYTDPDPAVMQARYDAVLDCTAALLRQRIWVFSPIVHCHPMAVKHEMPKDISFWLAYDTAMVGGSTGLFILMLDGFQESKGIAQEKEIARALSLPIRYISATAESYSFIEEDNLVEFRRNK